MSGLVLLAAPGRSTNVVFWALQRAFGVKQVILEERVRQRELLRGRWKRLGPRRVAGQVLFRALVVPPLRRSAEPRVQEILREHGLSDAPIPEAQVQRVPSVNDPACARALSAADPDVVMINGTRIIKGAVLSAVQARFLNIHVGITPTYRGVHGGYWALAAGEPEACGVTVYFVDPGIDTGAVIAQAVVHPTPADNFVTYPFLQLAMGLPLALDAIRRVHAGEAPTQPLPARPSRLWSHPTLGEYLWNRLARGVK